MIKKFFMKNVFEKLYYLILYGAGSFRFYDFINKAQWKPLGKNIEIQKELLYNIVNYSIQNIPYYKKAFKKCGVSINKNSIFEDIRKLPPLTKDVLRNEYDNLHGWIDEKQVYTNSSGGSTGQPVNFLQDKVFKYKMLLVKKLQKEWAGYTSGEVEIKIWGSERDILKQKEIFIKKLWAWLMSSYFLNSFSMNYQIMRCYVKEINKRKPKLILAYVTSIYDLARFIGENKITVFKPKAIMTSAGVLHSHHKKIIEKVFNCQVFNRYGTREVGDIACDCEMHEGLHVSMFTHYVEILDKNLNPCKEGQIGDIYITLLTNYTMPLIRYKIGDRAVFTNKKCSCGRGLSMLKRIIGRESEVLYTKDGRLIQGQFFIHFLGVIFNQGTIQKFQVIQRDYDDLEIKIVVKDERSLKFFKDKVQRIVKITFGESCNITWNCVKDIKPLKSGKYAYTINKIKSHGVWS